MRLIDADELKKDLKQYFTDGVLDGVSARLAFNQILHDIDNAPTVKLDEGVIQEVLNKRCMTAVANEYLIALHGQRPQGEWIIDNWGIYHCNYCMKEKQQLFNNFCSNCGAKMRS